MEYYDIGNKEYLALVKNKSKRPVTKICVLTYSETTMMDISDDVIRDSDNISITYTQGVQGKISFD